MFKYSTTIKFDNIDRVVSFVSLVEDQPIDVDIIDGNYIVDGKSLMGILSIDLSKRLTLVIRSEDEDYLNKTGLIKEIEKYKV
jgi:hypothetical protein